jgi:hypothetical protein
MRALQDGTCLVLPACCALPRRCSLSYTVVRSSATKPGLERPEAATLPSSAGHKPSVCDKVLPWSLGQRTETCCIDDVVLRTTMAQTQSSARICHEGTALVAGTSQAAHAQDVAALYRPCRIGMADVVHVGTTRTMVSSNAKEVRSWICPFELCASPFTRCIDATCRLSLVDKCVT